MIDAFNPGSLVVARGREWTVLPESAPDTLRLRPLGGSDEEATLIYLPIEKDPIRPARFSPPDPERAGNQESVLLLREALRLRLRSGAGPFRSVGNLGFEPRAYQIVPLLMALKLETVRLLIADDVGVGKTIEAGLIARELLDRGTIERMTVICPPHLCDQWEEELREKFRLQATVVQARTASRLERGLPAGRSLFEEHPITVVSLDYIKSEKRRDEFVRSCPEFVIVEEAHACIRSSAGMRHQRYLLLRELAVLQDRHMVFLTATPHSGNDDAFFNLLGLLDPDFSTLGETGGKERERLRERLASHFVQRRRPDIEEWRDARFFPDRESREATYKLSGEMESFFTDILSYARDLVGKVSDSGRIERRLNWWAALALLRCACSSPRAAVLALSTRLASEEEIQTSQEFEEALETQGIMTVMDGDEASDDLSSDDRVPGAEVPENLDLLDSPVRSLIDKARTLEEPGKDPKLAGLLPELRRLLKEGFNPVIFCRYIATAEYLKSHLERVFGDSVILDAVTGLLPPEEREERIAAFGTDNNNGKARKGRILVATDCLSEGINLQKSFDAVIHYDLSWNPTRHEQREGRVDRFGQPREKVRVVLYYGENNPVDGTVLEVILRKAETIRRELGVALPFPTDSTRVLQAVMESVFFRTKGDGRRVQGKLNLTFDLSAEERLPVVQEADLAWESARDNASKRSRTIFAQNRLRPADVLPEWNRSRALLGSDEDVLRYVKLAAQRLGAPLEEGPDRLYYWNPDFLPEALRDAFRDVGFSGRHRVAFSPGLPGLVLHRSHPIVVTLANYLSEIALAEKADGILSRSGAIFSRSVSKKTVLLLVRFRNQIVTFRRNRSRTLLAEELQIVELRGGEPPELSLSDHGVALMESPASRNMDPEQRKRLVRQTVEALPDLSGELERVARERAEALKDDHQRVLSASQSSGGRFEVFPNLPPDVIGITILMPDRLPENSR